MSAGSLRATTVWTRTGGGGGGGAANELGATMLLFDILDRAAVCGGEGGFATSTTTSRSFSRSCSKYESIAKLASIIVPLPLARFVS